MKGNNFHERHVVGSHIVAQSVADTTVNGSAITKPWRDADQLTFIVNLGAQASSPVLTLTLQAQKISDDSWVTWADADGNGAAWADAALTASTTLIGTVPLAHIQSDTYKALRLAFVNATNGSTALISVTYVLSELHRVPSAQADGFFASFFNPAIPS